MAARKLGVHYATDRDSQPPEKVSVLVAWLHLRSAKSSPSPPRMRALLEIADLFCQQISPRFVTFAISMMHFRDSPMSILPLCDEYLI